MQGYFDQTQTLICRTVPYDQGAAFNPSLRETCVWRSVQTPVVEGQRMLGCAGNEYMAGYHKEYNRIACCPTRRVTDPNANPPTTVTDPVHLFVNGNDEAANQGVFFDMKTPASGICDTPSQTHICPETSLMFGLNLNRNYFMCGW